MGYVGPQYTKSTTPNAVSNPAFPDWQQYMASLQLNPDMYPDLQKQAKIAAQLAASTGLTNLAKQRATALQQYKWGKSELDPAYQRFVQEQNYNLGQTQAENALARDRSNQDYDMSSRNLGTQLQDQLKRTEQDMARRGLWQSGILANANLGLQGKYIQSQGDIENSRYNRMADINRLGQLAEQKATFNLSDAQRERVAKLQKLLEGYQGNVNNMDLEEQKLTENQGLQAEQAFMQLMQQQYVNALNARKQGLSERSFWNNSYWAQANADEDRRRYEIQRQLDAAARKAQGLTY
jgi:hypothetical protein